MKFSALFFSLLVGMTLVTASSGSSWVFDPGRFTHDPVTGARVAQYARKPPIEPLADTRAVTSRYRRTQTVLRGTDGSRDTYYQVQSWGNGRGGIDAEWERFHNAWQSSFLSGSYYQYGSGLPQGYLYPQAGYGGFPGEGGFPAGGGHYPQHPQHGYFPPHGYVPQQGRPNAGPNKGRHGFDHREREHRSQDHREWYPSE